MADLNSFYQNKTNQDQNQKPNQPHHKLNVSIREKETAVIHKALLTANQPLTRRQLSYRTKLEIATLCRALFNLVHKSKTVNIAKYDYCETTGRKVMHFAAIKRGHDDRK